MDAERVQTEIRKVIDADPTIREANRIIVSVEKKGILGLGKEVVVLTGSVHDGSDRAKVEKIATLHAAGREVRDSIQVLN
jgi:hypothetical protein